MPLPIQPNPIYDSTWERLGIDWGILLFTAMIYVVIALYLQKRKDAI
jgi:ABC-type multidrug transport system permease subunit